MENYKDTYRIKDKLFKKFIDRTQIEETVNRIAKEINNDYNGKSPVFVIILKGSIFFAADLLRRIELHCEIETIRAKSYGYSLESGGKVNLMISQLDITGKDVIIVEDIVDTGYTITKLLEKLNLFSPNSIAVASFLSKPDKRKVKVDVKYIGIEIPSNFVVGYGLDFAELGRQLPDIYSLTENVTD